MGTDKGTLVTLNTPLYLPFRNGHGYPPLLIGGGTIGVCTVFPTHKSTHGQIVAFHALHR